MVSRSLIQRLFAAFSIERWNDQIRPVPLIEMDKHAHKMAVAYCLARSAEDAGQKVDWPHLVRGGVFELLRRCVLSDIKSPIYRELKQRHARAFRKLSRWVFEQLAPEVGNKELLAELREYLLGTRSLDKRAQRILDAAHIYASRWELQIIRRASGQSDDITRIESETAKQLDAYKDLPGLEGLLRLDGAAKFLDLVGQLRFQVRWAQTPRVQRTSVLGHSMMVATLAYLLIREVKNPIACRRRWRNSFFGGLFHDLPEAVTRDIVSPVKRAVPEVERIIGTLEKQLVRKLIYPHVKGSWRRELRYFTEHEFSCKIVTAAGRVTAVPAISREHNKDEYDPYDGALIEAADQLAAFLEAKKSIDAGVSTPELQEAAFRLMAKYRDRTAEVEGVNIASIYSDWR